VPYEVNQSDSMSRRESGSVPNDSLRTHIGRSIHASRNRTSYAVHKSIVLDPDVSNVLFCNVVESLTSVEVRCELAARVPPICVENPTIPRLTP